MKKLVITISLLAGATVGYSQGIINWTDYDAAISHPATPAFSITIFGPATAGAAAINTAGNTANDFPAGTATYAGAALASGYTVGLYADTSAAAVAADVASGTPVATSAFQTGANAGTWSFATALDAAVPGLASGTSVYVELAAWSDATGSPTSYASALAHGDLAGTSLVSSGTTTLGGGGSPPATPGTLAGIGITDFTIGTAVPEPSTIALGIMGASAFLMRLRRKV